MHVNIDRQQKPASIHFMINPLHGKIVDEYLNDLRDAVEKVKENPDLAKQATAPVYGMLANVPLRGMVESEVRKIVEDIYKGTSPEINLEEQNTPDNVLTIIKKLFSYLSNK